MRRPGTEKKVTFSPKELLSSCLSHLVLCREPQLAAGQHSSPKSHPAAKSHDLSLYNRPVTEQLEPRASKDESAAPVANRTQVLRFHCSLEAGSEAEGKVWKRLGTSEQTGSEPQALMLCPGAGSWPADCWGGRWANPWLLLGRGGLGGTSAGLHPAGRAPGLAGSSWRGGAEED